jgi:SAM-dependent methyltransferase
LNGGVDAQGWDDRYQDSELVWSATPNLFVAQHLSDRTPGTAIDLGAGEGRNAVWLATQGWDVTAVDFSAVGLAKARAMAFEAQVELATVVSDVDRYHPTTPVDLVLLSYLQVPDEHQARILHRAAEWLQPGGAVFVVAHDKANVENGHGGPPDPDVCYTVENTVDALSELRIEVAELAQRTVDGAVALDTVVLAIRD